MALPPNITDPEVRARFVESRRRIVDEFDSHVATGTSRREAAALLGHSHTGIEAMRRSIAHLTSGEVRIGPGSGDGIDLGLALLGCLRRPGEVLTRDDIAAWCGCSGTFIWQIEQRALAKLKRKLLESVRGTDLAEEVEALFGGVAAV